MTGIFLQTPAYQQLILSKVCQELYNDTICENIQQNQHHLKSIQSKGSYLILIYIAIMSLLSIIPALILGTCSDVGSRKPGMALPCIFSIAAGGLLIVVDYLKTMNVYWTFGAAALIGISGGHVAMFLSVFSYLADVTKNSNRTLRMGIAESMIFIGGMLGFFLGGNLMQYSTFTVIFGIFCGCNLIATIFVIFWLQESTQNNDDQSLYQECHCNENQEVTQETSVSIYIKRAFQSIFRHREAQNRLKIHLILICIFLINLCNVGEQSIMLMYLSYPPRLFSNQMYGWFTSSKMLISGLCLLCSFHCLLTHVEETTLAKIGILMRAASFLLLAFSTTKWMVFLSSIINAPSGYTMAVLRSLSSKIAHPSEQGAMFSFLASVETICLLVGAALFNGLYPETLSTFPGICFIIMATFQIITLVLTQWISEIPTAHPMVLINEE
ncbi:proton-coupled folate transporter-like [Pelobates fuscus]|uniref:proton-coupled folate transporter-like n=1 Tax=Pelobates fuscus TaxID=191477 RepID=UPI002FE44E47